MATLHQDRNAFSTLEWVWDTGAATAPEPLVTSIHSGNDSGLEIDANNSGPEVRQSLWSWSNNLLMKRYFAGRARKSITIPYLQKSSIVVTASLNQNPRLQAEFHSKAGKRGLL